MKALHKRPEDRYPTMDEFMRALADPVGYVEAHGGIAGFQQTRLMPSSAPMPAPSLHGPSIAPLTPLPGSITGLGGLQTPTTLGGSAGEVGVPGRRQADRPVHRDRRGAWSRRRWRRADPVGRQRRSGASRRLAAAPTSAAPTARARARPPPGPPARTAPARTRLARMRPGRNAGSPPRPAAGSNAGSAMVGSNGSDTGSNAGSNTVTPPKPEQGDRDHRVDAQGRVGVLQQREGAPLPDALPLQGRQGRAGRSRSRSCCTATPRTSGPSAWRPARTSTWR